MLTAPPDHLSAALERLDAVDRALLDLSLRRSVDDETIGGVLRIMPDEVERRREAVLDRLAAQLEPNGGSDAAELRTALAHLPDEAWRSQNGHARPAARRRLPLVALLATVVAAGAAATVVAIAGGGDAGRKPSAGGPAPAGPAPVVPLDPVTTGTRAHGTAQLVGGGAGRRLELRVSGLRPLEEAYAVWLYDSVTDARYLGRSVHGSFRLDLRLPTDPARYRYVDVSLEPLDGNPNHSGQSVLRVPTSRLEADRSR
jgi:anti-sigma-K factor RskA